MNAYFTVAAESISVIGAVCFVQIVMLAFRNPFRPALLHKEAIAVIVSIALVVILGMAVASEVHGLTRVGFDPFLAMAVAVALGVGTAWANWRLFSLGVRLRQADSGQSPFRLVRNTVPPSATATGA